LFHFWFLVYFKYLNQIGRRDNYKEFTVGLQQFGFAFILQLPDFLDNLASVVVDRDCIALQSHNMVVAHSNDISPADFESARHFLHFVREDDLPDFHRLFVPDCECFLLRVKSFWIGYFGSYLILLLLAAFS